MKCPFPACAFAIGFTLAATITGPVFGASQADLKSQLEAANDARDRQAIAEIHRRLFAAKPNDVDVLKGLIRAELNLGDSDAARVLIASLEQSVAADDVDLLELQGDLLRRDQKFDEASRAWQDALQVDPDNTDLLAKLATHYLYQEKNPAAAATYFKKLLPLRKTSGDHIQVGKVAIAMRDWTVLIERTTALKTKFATDSAAKKQIPAFERIIDATMRISELDAREKAQEDPVPVILERARFLLDSGFPELALNDARRALKLKPHAVHVRLHYAAAAGRIGEDIDKISAWGINAYRFRRSAPSVKFLDRLAELDALVFDDPDHIEALADRAQLLYENEYYELARVDAEHVQNLDSDHVQALRVLALLAVKNGYFGKAVKLVDKANALAPDDLLVLDAASYIHSRQGNFQRTIQLCDHWLTMSANDEDAQKRRQIAIENLQK